MLTLLVVIGTMNAVNFVDGLDGLAAGVVGIGASAFFLYCYTVSWQNNLTLVTTGALLSAALAGACAGFLPHNFHPARLFMGDSGSMLIGLVLSASTLTLTGQFFGMPTSSGNSLFVTVLPVLLPVSLLMVPIVDLVLAVVRRTRAGRSPMSADKQHLHHRLLEIGHSQRRAVLIMWLWAFTLATGAVLREPVRRDLGLVEPRLDAGPHGHHDVRAAQAAPTAQDGPGRHRAAGVRRGRGPCRGGRRGAGRGLGRADSSRPETL